MVAVLVEARTMEVRRMIRASLALMIMLTVLSIGCRQREEIRPGVGVGSFVVGQTPFTAALKSEKTRKKYYESGISYYSEDGNVVNCLIVHGRQYHTRKGIYVGAPASQVLAAYGQGIRRESLLMGGDRPLGKFADYGIVYQGIQFMISNRTVVAIIVVP
jgi:hypothetical protein